MSARIEAMSASAMSAPAENFSAVRLLFAFDPSVFVAMAQCAFPITSSFTTSSSLARLR